MKVARSIHAKALPATFAATLATCGFALAGGLAIEPAQAQAVLQPNATQTITATAAGEDLTFSAPASSYFYVEITPTSRTDDSRTNYSTTIVANYKQYEKDSSLNYNDGTWKSNKYSFASGTPVTVSVTPKKGTYALKVRLVVETAPNFETEDNNSQATANTLSLGNARTGISNTDDVDCYVFTAPENGKFAATARGTGGEQYFTVRLEKDFQKKDSFSTHSGAGSKTTKNVDLLKGEQAYVYVTAKHTTGSKYGVYELAMTQTESATPVKPALRKAKAKKSKLAQLKWTVCGDANGYQIAYKAKKSKKWKYKEIAGSTKTSYSLSKLKARKKYLVKVRAYKTIAEKDFYSAWSNTKSFKAKK